MTGFVYLLEAETGQIKIGCSSEPERRRRAFSTYSPCPVRLIAQWPGTVEGERRLHARFVEHRQYGEWFACAGELAAFIEQMRGHGVAQIPEWAGMKFSSAEERRAAAGAKRSVTQKANWADPAFREMQRQFRAVGKSAKRPGATSPVPIDQRNAS